MEKFSVAQILTVASDVRCLENFGEIYPILNYMSGDDLMTTQLVRVAKEVTPYLLEQIPWLSGAVKKVQRLAGEGDAVLRYIAYLENLHGKFHTLIPIHPEDHENVDWIEDARRLGFKGGIIDIDFSEDGFVIRT